MVKEEELKPGITVWLNGYEDYLNVVDVVHLRELSAKFEDGEYSEIQRLEGIPITSERLIAMGFKDQTGGWGGSQGSDKIFKKLGIEIRTYDSDNLWHLSSDFETKFEFVHQLQIYIKDKMGKQVALK